MKSKQKPIEIDEDKLIREIGAGLMTSFGLREGFEFYKQMKKLNSKGRGILKYEKRKFS